MRTIAMVNIKGGVTKTTSVINIGAILAQKNYRVLIVDLDPQANATEILKERIPDEDAVTINEVFLDKDINIKTAIVKTVHENLDILPSTLEFTFAESKIIVDTTRLAQTRLKKALAQIQDDYDYCLLDCPPNIGIITINALVAADEVMVPTKIDTYSLNGLNHLVEKIFEIKNEFNDDLTFLGSFMALDENTVLYKIMKEQLQNTEVLKMFKTTIRKNIKVPESTFNQVPVVYDDKNALASLDYIKLVEELLDREKSIV